HGTVREHHRISIQRIISVMFTNYSVMFFFFRVFRVYPRSGEHGSAVRIVGDIRLMMMICSQ
ncbi:MAG TPA: hypothetical protein O0X38_01735, partial [Methanocorpusculum sp.]|nr:hypothetical protein [Methanocorpusculum sp.]